MAAEHQYFYEDEVYRVNKKGNIEFGMVLENSELVSSDENSDAEDGGRMKKGHIRVAWHPTGVEEVIPERKVCLADRSLMPGDVVRRMVKGKDTQRGYCRDIRVTASVQVVGSKQVIPNVKSEHLIPLEEFAADIAACLDSWVGGIKTVQSKLQLRCADGSRCVVNDIDACGLEDFNEKRDCECEFPGHREDFYPGQTLWGPLHCLEEADWVHCTKEMKSMRSKPNKFIKVVVEEVKTESVGVHWQCRAYSREGAGNDKEQPKFLVQGEDLKRLKLLNVFEPCTLQVGDRNFYTFREEDTVITKEQWRRSQRELILSSNTIVNGPNKRSTRRPRGPRWLTAPSWFLHSSIQRASHLRSTPAHAAMEVIPAAERNGTEGGDEEDKKQQVIHQEQLVQEQHQTVPAAPVSNNGNSGLLPPPPPPPQTAASPEQPSSLSDWDTEDTASISDTASVSSGCSSTGSQGKKKRGPALMTKVLKKKKLLRTRKRAPPVQLTPGTRVVVETLSTSSVADVVWQDGSVEYNIPSTELYPIHHLDDQEFFPGDFVIENKEDACMRVYGVVQSVDHAGRTATVKWFKTYASLETPQPQLLEQNEVSVYDLKDHPDFQYRPGTVVIRVANFEGEDANCTAGQVLDNYPEGKVRVWWVDGHISMSWPQDLYKVGEYDSDEGEFWDDNSSEASWETESEDCFIAEEVGQEDELQEMLKPKLAANIEKARIAMSRLEEIFTQNPALQTTSVMRQLLDVYKDCRYLDKLMGTSFFHESHFQGLLERVRERGRANVAQRVADQVNRLFHRNQQVPANEQDESGDQDIDPSRDIALASGEFLLSENLASLERRVVTAANNSRNSETAPSRKLQDKPSATTNLNKSEGVPGSGQQQQVSEGRAARYSSQAQQQNQQQPTVANSQVCVKLCALIKAQLVQAHAEVTRRFGGNQGLMALSDALSESPHPGEKQDVEEPEPMEEDLPAVAAVPTTDAKAPSQKAKAAVGQPGKTFRVSASNNTKAPTCPTGEELPVEPSQKEMSAGPETPSSPAPAPQGAAAVDEDAGEAFSVMEAAPNSHKFKLTMFQPTDPQNFFRTVRKELKLLRTSLPDGIWVKGFEDRMDLYSVMIRGPERTPYEDGLFFFDFQLSADYPKAPPLCHYISYCSDRLNPNLYEDGKVCVSLLGTWSGKGTEVWTSNSNLLQVIVSIQGLILVSEPYFNEAGYEKQKGSQQGKENSRMYNEMAVLKLVQAMTKLLLQPPPVFKEEIIMHFNNNASKLLRRLESWLDISERYNTSHPLSPTTPTTFRQLHETEFTKDLKVPLPDFPLIPASKGFCLTLRKTLVTFREVLASVGVLTPAS